MRALMPWSLASSLTNAKWIDRGRSLQRCYFTKHMKKKWFGGQMKSGRMSESKSVVTLTVKSFLNLILELKINQSSIAKKQFLVLVTSAYRQARAIHST
jgi:hypothetical protein